MILELSSKINTKTISCLGFKNVFNYIRLTLNKVVINFLSNFFLHFGKTFQKLRYFVLLRFRSRTIEIQVKIQKLRFRF